MLRRSLTRALPTTALLAALAVPAGAFDLENMTDIEREAFGAAVRNYILENPEVVMEAARLFQERQELAAAAGEAALIERSKDAIFNDGYSHVGGNPEGDVTIVEFIDYRCGFCRRAHDEVAELVESDGNIRIITKEFPILGPNSVASSEFAIAVKQVAGPDAYERANDALIRLGGDMSPAALRRLAGQLDVDASAVLSAMKSEDVQKEIATTRALARQLQINGTPTFVFQDQLMRGYLPLAEMRALVSAIREEG